MKIAEQALGVRIGFVQNSLFELLAEIPGLLVGFGFLPYSF